jgi:hypothetical protein
MKVYIAYWTVKYLNLNVTVQACENSSPPTIKSVLFHGSAYDRFLLTDLPNSDSSSQEFLVGKYAAPYVTQYHNLHHFKYRLYQRCRAKVSIIPIFSLCFPRPEGP